MLNIFEIQKLIAEIRQNPFVTGLSIKDWKEHRETVPKILKA